MRTRSARELFTSEHGARAAGVLLLEFSAALSVYVSAVTVPRVVGDLDAAGEYPLIVSGASVGLFLALALARRTVTRFGGAAVLGMGLVFTVAGAVVSASAPTAVAFALGRLSTGLGSGLLGVFGVSTVIATVPQHYRVRLVALTASVWILPEIVGPSLAVVAIHLVGWRWTLLLPVPLVLLARALVGRAALQAADHVRDREESRSGGLRRPAVAFLLPFGMAVFVFGSATALGSWALIGLGLAVVGALGLLPPGTVRAAPGPPRWLALLAVVSVGYFGADALLTSIATRADGIGLAWVSVALGAAAVGWALASMLQPRLTGVTGARASAVLRLGLGLMTSAAAVLVVLQLTGTVSGPLMLAIWPVAGVGMGFLYPAVYLRATTAEMRGPLSGAPAAAILATAVLVAESAGSVIGGALGSGVVDLAQRLGTSEATGVAHGNDRVRRRTGVRPAARDEAEREYRHAWGR
jgi:MFS family permease